MKYANKLYYNPDWPEYVCSDCGVTYYFKFKDYDKCLSCLESEGVFESIEQKLISYNNERIRLIRAYKERY